eukprot:1309866-Pyramimonas_sp.AAC.1
MLNLHFWLFAGRRAAGGASEPRADRPDHRHLRGASGLRTAQHELVAPARHRQMGCRLHHHPLHAAGAPPPLFRPSLPSFSG